MAWPFVDAKNVAAVHPASPGDDTHCLMFRSGGDVAPGYESVRERFIREFLPGGQEDRAQLCVYVRGVKVVDVWASRVVNASCSWGRQPNEQEYGPSSLQNIFSSTKVLTSLVVAMLVERGHLAYDRRIAELWPEFGCRGKEATTLGMVMRHEAGLSVLDRPIDVSALTPEAIRSGYLSEVIASQKASHPPGTKRMYHALTRGWILNEVVRRADPAGRTIGEFLLDEVSTPLGLQSELRIGLPEELHSHVAPLHYRSGLWFAQQIVLPRAAGGGRIVGLTAGYRISIFLGAVLAIAVAPVLALGGMLASFQSAELTVGGEKLESLRAVFNSPDARKSEIPSANGHASARALAKVAATIAAGGISPDGVRLLSDEGVADAHGSPVTKRMLGMVFTFSNAGWCLWGDKRLGFVGWMGLGGSVVQWHREEQIGFGYALNSMQVMPFNSAAYLLQKQVLACVLTAKKVA